MKITFILLIGAALAAVTTAQAAVSQQTLDNLNTAFQGESNAAHRYEAFAKKADAQGYLYVARLFRAAAKAEGIHRETHKKAILELGGTINDFQLEEVIIGTTAENLQAAIKGESYERDTMYPEFLAQAKADRAKPAIRLAFRIRTSIEELRDTPWSDRNRIPGIRVQITHRFDRTRVREQAPQFGHDV